MTKIEFVLFIVAGLIFLAILALVEEYFVGPQEKDEDDEHY